MEQQKSDKQAIPLIILNSEESEEEDFNFQQKQKDNDLKIKENMIQQNPIQIIQNDQNSSKKASQFSKLQIPVAVDRNKNRRQSNNLFDNPNILTKFTQLMNNDYLYLEDQDVREVLIEVMKRKGRNDLLNSFIQKILENGQYFQKDKESRELLQNKNVMNLLFQKIELVFYKKREVIFQQGDQGFNFFILVDGKVDLLQKQAQISLKQKQGIQSGPKKFWRKLRRQILQQNQDGGGSDSNRDSQQQTPHTGQSNFSNAVSVSRQSQNQSQQQQQQQDQDFTPQNVKAFDWEMTDEDFYRKYFQKYDLIKCFQPGDSFGEIALKSGGARTGTMICTEDSYLLTLDKQSYIHLMGRYQEDLQTLNLKFLKQFAFFQQIPGAIFMSFSRSMTSLKMARNCVIFEEGENSGGLFFIQKGEVEILKNFSFDFNQTENEFDSLFEDKKKSVNKKIVLKEIGEGNFFGEYEIIEKYTNRTFSARVKKDCELLYVKKDNLLNQLINYGGINSFTKESLLRNQQIEKYAAFIYQENLAKLAKIIYTNKPQLESQFHKEISLEKIKQLISQVHTVQPKSNNENQTQNKNQQNSKPQVDKIAKQIQNEQKIQQEIIQNKIIDQTIQENKIQNNFSTSYFNNLNHENLLNYSSRNQSVLLVGKNDHKSNTKPQANQEFKENLMKSSFYNFNNKNLANKFLQNNSTKPNLNSSLVQQKPQEQNTNTKTHNNPSISLINNEILNNFQNTSQIYQNNLFNNASPRNNTQLQNQQTQYFTQPKKTNFLHVKRQSEQVLSDSHNFFTAQVLRNVDEKQKIYQKLNGNQNEQIQNIVELLQKNKKKREQAQNSDKVIFPSKTIKNNSVNFNSSIPLSSYNQSLSKNILMTDSSIPLRSEENEQDIHNKRQNTEYILEQIQQNSQSSNTILPKISQNSFNIKTQKQSLFPTNQKIKNQNSVKIKLQNQILLIKNNHNTNYSLDKYKNEIHDKVSWDLIHKISPQNTQKNKK